MHEPEHDYVMQFYSRRAKRLLATGHRWTDYERKFLHDVCRTESNSHLKRNNRKASKA
jgi:hypothetical protein